MLVTCIPDIFSNVIIQKAIFRNSTVNYPVHKTEILSLLQPFWQIQPLKTLSPSTLHNLEISVAKCLFIFDMLFVCYCFNLLLTVCTKGVTTMANLSITAVSILQVIQHTSAKYNIRGKIKTGFTIIFSLYWKRPLSPTESLSTVKREQATYSWVPPVSCG